MLAAYGYTGHAGLERAGGALGVAAAFVLYYVGTAAFLTKNTRCVALPLSQSHHWILTVLQLLYASRWKTVIR